MNLDLEFEENEALIETDFGEVYEIGGGGGGGGDTVNGITPEPITGDCSYRFAYNGWNWLLEQAGNTLVTQDVSNIYYMFSQSDTLEEIPLAINCGGATYYDINSVFENCKKLKTLPSINNLIPRTMTSMFRGCSLLREIPNEYCDTWDWSYLAASTGNIGGKTYIFYGCSSLRTFPLALLSTSSYNIGYNFSYLPGGFGFCYALDELINLPITWTSTWTSNTFGSSFSYCSRLKNLTFALQEDGTPYVMQWKNQTIDLATYVGYCNNATHATGYNSGITKNSRVSDDETYQALKDDPDWFTTDIAYSRYNHDSAVATINSLPDTSAYLSSVGGTNTIKFKGEAGSATDGGAINTLTEEEIAVATAKGWTVTLV